MKIIEVNHHCFGRNATIDGVDFKEVVNKRELIAELLKKIDEDDLYEIFETVMDFTQGVIEDDMDNCEQCGNNNWYRKWDLELNDTPKTDEPAH